jgi:hypothetical protein
VGGGVQVSLCECGCGESVNPYLEKIFALRDEGLSKAAIGRRLGISREYVKLLMARPPRFVQNHYSPFPRVYTPEMATEEHKQARDLVRSGYAKAVRFGLYVCRVHANLVDRLALRHGDEYALVIVWHEWQRKEADFPRVRAEVAS